MPKKPDLPKITREAMQQMVLEGLTDSEIAERCNVARTTVGELRRRYGFAANRHTNRTAVTGRMLNTGEWVTYPSLYAAACATGLYSNAIRDCCLGKQRSSGGYEWRFAAVWTGQIDTQIMAWASRRP